MAPVAVGEVMRAAGVGRVVASRSADYAVGQWVAGPVGWQERAIARGGGADRVQRRPAGIKPRAMLGLYGVTGLTACFGMLDVGRPQAGETVYVSAAAGATGSVAGQIAKALGCRVIGSAGGARKCASGTEVAGFDACLDRHVDDLEAGLPSAPATHGGTLYSYHLERLVPVDLGAVARGAVANGDGQAARDPRHRSRGPDH